MRQSEVGPLSDMMSPSFDGSSSRASHQQLHVTNLTEQPTQIHTQYDPNTTRNPGGHQRDDSHSALSYVERGHHSRNPSNQSDMEVIRFDSAMNRVIRGPSRRVMHDPSGEHPFESGQDASHMSNQMNEWQKTMQMNQMQRLEDVDNEELGEDSQINGESLDQYLKSQSSMDFQSDGIRVSQSQAEGFGGLNQSEENSRQLRQSVDSNINLDAETPSTPNNPLGKIPSVYFDESDTQQSQLSDPNAMRLNKITSNINSQADQLHRMG